MSIIKTYIVNEITFDEIHGNFDIKGWEGETTTNDASSFQEVLKDQTLYFKLFQVNFGTEGTVKKWRMDLYTPPTNIPEYAATYPFGFNGGFSGIKFGESCATNVEFKAKELPDANCTNMLVQGFKGSMYMGFIGTDDMRNGRAANTLLRLNKKNNNNETVPKFIYLSLQKQGNSNHYKLICAQV